MKKEINIIKYDTSKGLQLSWERNFAIGVKYEENELVIAANNEGLISLANHLLTLAQDEVPLGAHIHYDKYSSLEDGSIDLIIEKRGSGCQK